MNMLASPRSWVASALDFLLAPGLYAAGRICHELAPTRRGTATPSHPTCHAAAIGRPLIRPGPRCTGLNTSRDELSA
jgi:hypothetical protein